MEYTKEDIIDFIEEFVYHPAGTSDGPDTIRSLFRAGYCLYFAEMLQKAFNRGRVCWAAPTSHMVWEDIDGTAYDIEGEYYPDVCFALVPFEYLGKFVVGYRHLPDESETYERPTKKELCEVIQRYINDLRDGKVESLDNPDDLQKRLNEWKESKPSAMSRVISKMRLNGL